MTTGGSSRAGMAGWSEPTLSELAEALAGRVADDGAVPPGAGAALAAERRWRGRLVDVLAVLTEDATRMGYLAGGRKPAEVMTWLPLWAGSPFTVDQIRTIVASAGWDPEPFAVVVRHGLLDRFVRRPDGSPRRVRGELAGGWLSDRFAQADDEEILREVRRILDDDHAPHEGARPTSDGHGATTVHLGLESGYRLRADFGDQKAPVFLDEPTPLGLGSAPNASALLGAAVGDCLSASLLFCLRRAHLDVDGLEAEVRVTPTRNAEGRLRVGAIDVVLHPETGAAREGRFDRCLDIFEDYCVVTDSIRHGIDVTVTVAPRPGGRGPAHGGPGR